MSWGEAAVETAIQSKGLTAPRLTPVDIDAAIVSEQYHVFPGTTLTVCVLTLRNGFTVTGESAAASPENFDEEVGRGIARKNAREKIWPLEGYLLRDRLHLKESRKSQAPGALGLALWDCVKRVSAGEITQVDRHGCVVRLASGAVMFFHYPDDKMTARYQPKVGDFWVVYEGGYPAISPRDAFLKGYIPANGEPL